MSERHEREETLLLTGLPGDLLGTIITCLEQTLLLTDLPADLLGTIITSLKPPTAARSTCSALRHV